MARRTVLVPFLAGLLLSAPAGRAESPLEPPDLSRFLRWGPVRVRPGFVISNLGYEDNVFFRSEESARGCDDGDPTTACVPIVGDFVATLSPRLDGLVLFGNRAFLTFAERLDYTVYRQYSELNYLNQLGKGRLTVPFGTVGVYLDATLNRTKDRPADFQDIRNEVTETGVGTGIVLGLGWRTDAEVGVFRTSWRNRDPDATSPQGFSIADRLDRVERGERFQGRYLAFGRTRFTLDLSRRTITFDNPALGRDAEERRLLPGVDFGRGGPLSGTLRVGRVRFDAKDPSRMDFSGSVGDAALAYRLGSATTVHLGGRRELRFSVYEGNQWFLDTGYDARAVHYLNRLLGLEAGAGRRRLTFSDTADRVDRIVQYDVGVRLRFSENALGRRVEYSLKVGRYRRDSTLPNLDLSRATIGINATIGY